jgi:hypothetical protein
LDPQDENQAEQYAATDQAPARGYPKARFEDIEGGDKQMAGDDLI